MSKMLIWTVAVVLLLAVGTGAVVLARSCVRFARDRRAADEAWRRERPARVTNLGTVERLTVLPLLDYFAADPALATQAGISYLVTADETSILFDVGGNPKEQHPLPLVSNAERLGVDLGRVNCIVISHLHDDHVGNLGELLTDSPVAERLRQTPVYLPAPMRTPRATFRVVEGPTVLARGVASSGPISKAYWAMGAVAEQTLAVDVAGKGIVLISGCGHQSLERMLERAGAIFDAPVYGVIGGLHFPATGFRDAPGYLAVLIRVASTGKQPWHGLLGKADVRRGVATLEAARPSLVALSPHDSCDWTIGEFKRAFGPRYKEVQVGREIVVD